MAAGARSRLLELLRARAFERKRVVLASGRESDFFIDCKQAVLTAEGHALVGEAMLEAIAAFPGCVAVAGVELGGCPLASAVALTSFQRGAPLDAGDRGARRETGERFEHQLADERVALGSEDRLLAVDEEVALLARGERHLATRKGPLAEQLEQARAIAHLVTPSS